MRNNRLVNIFVQLVKIDSTSGHEDKIALFIKDYLKNLLVDVTVDNFGNIIAKKIGFSEPLLLSAHMDTVEPGRNIRPVLKGDIIKSDGTTILGADNKVALAIILELLSRLANQNHRSLEIVFTRSEEIGNYGAINLDYSLLTAQKGLVLDNPNPVGTIVTASPFYNRFDIKITGKAMHASKAEEGINVLLVLKDTLQEVTLGKQDSETIVNIGIINGGHVRNTVMGEIVLNGEVRSFDRKKLAIATDTIISTFAKNSEKYGAGISTGVVLENTGYRYSRQDQDIQHVSAAMQQCRITPFYRNDWGCSDANIFAENGIKVITIGDGAHLTHTTNEWISIKDMEKLFNLVLFLVEKKG